MVREGGLKTLTVATHTPSTTWRALNDPFTQQQRHWALHRSQPTRDRGVARQEAHERDPSRSRKGDLSGHQEHLRRFPKAGASCSETVHRQVAALCSGLEDREGVRQ
ncbi:hypothetical protein AU161_gp14 [Pseudomonas phage PPPL-1]|uniref:Uncharacterized protein n=1 Tax=Pseudomonas phage PPPL-1 TaxID=1755692 RepID=A0A0S2MVL8_9CAUD|nr:hypothetical protein AU161_gp14 [Pseudomonas phage PPPL-1]ALO79974.1 hypothetical protein PPPL1_014 [Pseudomonas phage PPPL-1]